MNESSEKQLVDLIKQLMSTVKKELEVSIPCEITAVTSRKKVTVKPLIKIVDKLGNTYSRDVIEGVPVFALGTSNMVASMPVAVGDKGWLQASDRDLSLFLQSFEESEPPTNRMHSFSDGLFVPDAMNDYTIAEEDAGALVIQTSDGINKITMDATKTRVVNGAVDITIEGGAVTGVAPAGFNLNSCIIAADGSITSPSAITGLNVAATVGLTAPTVAAGLSLTVATVEVAGHDHGGTTSDGAVIAPMA